jgi:hypothetical protein
MNFARRLSRSTMKAETRPARGRAGGGEDDPTPDPVPGAAAVLGDDVEALRQAFGADGA